MSLPYQNHQIILGRQLQVGRLIFLVLHDELRDILQHHVELFAIAGDVQLLVQRRPSMALQ